MQVIRAALLALLLASPAFAAEPPKTQVMSEKELVDDDGYVARLSLPTESDIALWGQPGLRIGLAYGYGHLWGTGPAQGLAEHALTIRALTRLDQTWSVGVDVQYALATGSTLGGLRYAATAQVLAQVWKQLAVGVGVGLGGLVLEPPSGPRARPPGNGEEVASLTFGPDAKLGSCSGSAWVGQVRAEYQFIAGPLFASGPYLQADAQRTLCQQTIGRTDRETGDPIYARQWWTHAGAIAGWWFTWR